MARRARSLLLPIATAAAVIPAAPAAAGTLQVWNLNTHKMQTCGDRCGADETDYSTFIERVAGAGKRAPDVITLQEVASKGSKPCGEFVRRLERRAGRHHYTCLAAKTQGGAAIVYRSGRDGLRPRGGKRLIGLRINKQGTSCENTSGKGYHALAQRFVARSTNATIDVASVHLPVNNNADVRDCTWQNSKRVTRALRGAVRIMAGDWNLPDAETGAADWNCWYKGTNAALSSQQCGPSLGWRDVIFDACDGARDCLQSQHWSHPKKGTDELKRIDFLFARGASSANAVTVPFGTPRYSDHRGQGALLRYGG